MQSYEKLFAQRQLEEFGEKQKKELAEKRRELDKAKLRVREIDGVIQKLYEEYYGAPGSHQAHHDLHTHYQKRENY